MSVRKRTWKTAAGAERQAWLCDYTGQSGKRHVKTFARKKDADAFIARAKVEVREGVHTADSDSVTIRLFRTFDKSTTELRFFHFVTVFGLIP